MDLTLDESMLRSRKHGSWPVRDWICIPQKDASRPRTTWHGKSARSGKYLTIIPIIDIIIITGEQLPDLTASVSFDSNRFMLYWARAISNAPRHLYTVSIKAGSKPDSGVCTPAEKMFVGLGGQ